MLVWLTENIGTILAAVLLLAIAFAALGTLIKDRKRGKTACGCNCSHCAMTGACHKK